jgi:hypothetical protein
LSTTLTGFVDLPTRLRAVTEQWNRSRWQLMCDLRVAIPAVVVSFNEDTQCVRVQPAISENINVNSVSTQVDLPILGGADEGDEDIPVMVPRGGGVALTMPIQAGDECLLVFSDMALDSWWQSGGTSNAQVMRRRHALSDAVAIFGLWSQPNVLTDYSISSAQLRSEDGSTYLEVLQGAVNAAQNLNVENGASGSFVSQDAKTVTVLNGIIVNIA